MNQYLNLKIILITITLCHLCSSQVQGQSNDVEAGLANVGLGALVGGMGAIINKKPDEKTGKVFLKGLYQGAFGGYLVFESKRLVGKFAETENYAYVWPSKLVNSAGASIIENAALNTNFWEVWHLNIGFNRLQFYTKDKFKVDYRIMPFSLGATVYGFTQGNLDFRTFLKTGNFVFAVNKFRGISASGFDSEFIEGQAIGNVVLYKRNPSVFITKETIAHEIIHVYQYEGFSGFNSYLNDFTQKLNIKNNTINNYHKIFHTDYNFLILGGLYSINPKYDTNIFEREARYFVDNRIMD